jgi:hypothetical protein
VLCDVKIVRLQQKHPVADRGGVVTGGGEMKGLQKPKKLQKKTPQKTLKERRAEKRAGARQARLNGA